MRLLKPFAAAAFTLLLTISVLPLPDVLSSSTKGAESSFLKPHLPFSFTQNDAGTNVSVTGRVKTPEGRPIKGANIVLKDADTNQVVRTTFSSSFGYYRLEPIETGHFYVLSVTHRRYLFAFPAQLIEINEDRSGVDFTGEANTD